MVRGMILCSDPQVRAHMKRLYERVQQRLPSALAPQASWWKFDHFGDATIAAAAMETFLLADVVVFASREYTGLPEEVRWWISRWPSKSEVKDRSLLGYVEFRETDRVGPSVTEVYLRDVSHEMGLDYLPYHIPDFVPERASTRYSGHTVPEYETRHWGLNE